MGWAPRSLSLSLSLYSFLVNRGLLLVRDVGKACSWWFAIPGVSPFTKSYTKGKRTLSFVQCWCVLVSSPRSFVWQCANFMRTKSLGTRLSVYIGLALKIRGFPCLSPTHRQSHGAADDKKIQVQRNAAKGTGMFHTSIDPSLYQWPLIRQPTPREKFAIHISAHS